MWGPRRLKYPWVDHLFLSDDLQHVWSSMDELPLYSQHAWIRGGIVTTARSCIFWSQQHGAVYSDSAQIMSLGYCKAWICRSRPLLNIIPRISCDCQRCPWISRQRRINGSTQNIQKLASLQCSNFSATLKDYFIWRQSLFPSQIMRACWVTVYGIEDWLMYRAAPCNRQFLI